MQLDNIKILNPKLSDNGKILSLHLNHGRANEMGSELIQAWSDLAAILDSGDIRVLITTSQKKSKRGKPIFISGADVTERTGWSDQDVRTHVRWQRNTLQKLRKAPTFNICLVDGIALGWGTEFLLTCDYRLCTPQATFGLPETQLGILPGAGGTSDLWLEIGIAQALRLGMTGERIDGNEAQRIGLTQEMAENWDSGMARAMELGEAVCKRSPTAVAAYKRAMLAAIGRGPNFRQGLESRAYEHCVNTGEAAIGRENFKAILSGKGVEWGPFTPFHP